ncbi:cytochrome c-type biogenesis protein [Brucella sp. BE17]|uniref:cytochrome c-type biogenesis protein n=1 Tax=Brucella sp. BE17 TaxID=3142977 RepID=UPI0031BA6978
MRQRRLFAVLMVLAVSLFQLAPAWAVNPDEILPDAALEKRARSISTELRCMVCQNESIDDSNAELARDLRLLVRDRLKAGDTDAQVKDFVVDRYGEFVLLKPRLSAHTALLWCFPVIVLFVGGAAILFAVRRKTGASQAVEPLSEQEKVDLRRLLKDN